jgi:hypothetical protein
MVNEIQNAFIIRVGRHRTESYLYAVATGALDAAKAFVNVLYDYAHNDGHIADGEHSVRNISTEESRERLAKDLAKWILTADSDEWFYMFMADEVEQGHIAKRVGRDKFAYVDRIKLNFNLQDDLPL